MQRITKKPWFGKRYLGWGWRPVSIEGWLVTLAFIAIIVADLIHYKERILGIIFLFGAVILFLIIAFLTGDEPGSVLWDRAKSTKMKVALIVIPILIVLGAFFAIHESIVLDKAHSTFENYYAFRGCTQLVSRSVDSGLCKTNSGQTIKIVKFNNKWYLDGDLPFCWHNICL